MPDPASRPIALSLWIFASQREAHEAGFTHPVRKRADVNGLAWCLGDDPQRLRGMTFGMVVVSRHAHEVAQTGGQSVQLDQALENAQIANRLPPMAWIVI